MVQYPPKQMVIQSIDYCFVKGMDLLDLYMSQLDDWWINDTLV